jgi:hypothetical protein
MQVAAIEGEILCVSQFTLYARLKKPKPDYSRAMGPDQVRVPCWVGAGVERSTCARADSGIAFWQRPQACMLWRHALLVLVLVLLAGARGVRSVPGQGACGVRA